MIARLLLVPLALLCFSVGSSAQPAAPLDGRLKKIHDTRTLAIAYRTDAAPFSSVGADSRPVGYTIDLCQRVAESIRRQLDLSDLNIKWVPVTTQTRLTAVASGRADLECGSTTVTVSRMRSVDFSSIVFVDGTGLLIKTSNPAKGIADLAGKKIGVIPGTSNERALDLALKSREVAATVTRVANRPDGLAQLEAGSIDAFASDRMLLVGLARNASNASSLTLLTETLSYEPYAIVLPRGDWALRQAVNGALAQIYRSGAATEIYGRWFGAFGRMSPLMEAVYQLGALPE
jgi:glutamate/aspartate transport system substrate-binding protein